MPERVFLIFIFCTTAVLAFERGRHDTVATAEQSQELLRQAFGDYVKAGLRGRVGGSYDVMVLAANETFDDEYLYEDLDISRSTNATRPDMERHAARRKKCMFR